MPRELHATSVVLPDYRGPISVTIGYLAADRLVLGRAHVGLSYALLFFDNEIA